MSSDVKIFNVCNHLVNDVKYDISSCPRCYGKGYYFDIHFDVAGEAVLASGNVKLQQEVLKILIDEKYDNVFHQEWGSKIKTFVGSKNLNINKTKLEFIVRSALEYLKKVQMNETKNWNNLTDEEILDKIVSINITSIGQTAYNIDVVLSNEVGEIYRQSIIL